MKLGLHQSARLEQRLIQSPQMIQAMQILQLSALDLQERIEAELTENPFLELAEGGVDSEGPASEAMPANGRPGENGTAENGVDTDGGAGQMLELLERLDRDYGSGDLPRSSGAEDGDRKFEAMQNTAAAPKGVSEAIVDQLALLRLQPEDRVLLEYLAWSLDDRGYLRSDRAELALELERQLGRAVEEGEVEVGLEVLRSATHPALGARDLRECLLLQLPRGEPEDSLLSVLISEHLQDIQANRLPRIAKATGHSLEEIKEALTELRTLEPSPGSQYGQAVATVIHPEVLIEEVDGEFVVRLDRERVPRLEISPSYKRLLEQAKQSGPDGKEAREWIKKRYESATWFLDAVQQRQSTLRRIAEAVFKRQRPFLEKGIEALQPLRMQEIADEIGVHISTVSRGVSGKYAQTPRGIFPLKFFFTGGTTKDTGEVASQVSIKERVRKLIGAEDKQKPLSDDQIAALLAEHDGIKIARRTVTKYRKALGLPSSTQRRAY